jgi:hypothetical protein
MYYKREKSPVVQAKGADMAKDEVSPRMKKLLEKGREQARQNVIDRGLVQFRADPQMMEQLLQVSEERGIPLGTLLRSWVKDRLLEDAKTAKETDTLTKWCQEITVKLDAMHNSLGELQVKPQASSSGISYTHLTGDCQTRATLVALAEKVYGVDPAKASAAADIYLRKIGVLQNKTESAVREDVHSFEIATAIAALADSIDE